MKKGVPYTYHQSFVELPAQYARTKLSVAEMEVIESGGVPYAPPKPAPGAKPAAKK